MSEKQYKSQYDMNDFYYLKLYMEEGDKQQQQRCITKSSTSSKHIEPFYVTELRIAKPSDFQDSNKHGIIINWNQIIMQ